MKNADGADIATASGVPPLLITEFSFNTYAEDARCAVVSSVSAKLAGWKVPDQHRRECRWQHDCYSQ
jgi:hypothetical protein